MGSFELLDSRVQRWVWAQGWSSLRPIQEAAIPAILSADRDVILAAATAGGKTEAAFLPILSRLLRERRSSIEALYIGPLKALINDQFQRMELLCRDLDVPVHRWHGDVPGGRKREALKEPQGVLLITPESLEALFIIHGPRIPKMFQGVGCVVVDELHAYPGTERGRQLQSLLHRLDLALRRRVQRVGLSATLGDMEMAREFFRPGTPDRVHVIVSNEKRSDVLLLVKGYEERSSAAVGDDVEEAMAQAEPATTDQITRHLFGALRGEHHLVFANRKAEVEAYADRLRAASEASRVPNEFWPHHGSLSKGLREEVEARLKNRAVPTTVICTSTLEMGIDIGAVESIAQIGCPPSVASLRQRLGRSGRRQRPATLRQYVIEREISPRTSVFDALRVELVQSVAMLNLLLIGWCEPPAPAALHLSTLVQQYLSMIAQHGSVAPTDAWQALCRLGPFARVDQSIFEEFALALARQEMTTRLDDGTVTLGVAGERVVGHYSFYAAFQTSDEWTIVAGDRTLGAIPLYQPLTRGACLIFAGRRWKVDEVDESRRLVRVSKSSGGRAPLFGGSGPQIHDRVRTEMRSLYTSDDRPAFLDSTAVRLLDEGREAFRRLRLSEESVLADGNETLVFPWAGDRVLSTIALVLRDRDLDCSKVGIALIVSDCEPRRVRDVLRDVVERGVPSAHRLAAQVRNKWIEKHDPLLPDDILIADYADKFLDVDGARRVLSGLLMSSGSTTA